MIDHLTLELRYINRQLQSDSLTEFNELANTLIYKHILDPFLDGNDLDMLAMMRIMQEEQVNLEELMIDSQQAAVSISFLERDLTEFDAKVSLLSSSSEYSMQIICNHHQALLIQQFIIAYFPTFDYQTAKLDDLLYRYPVSIIPSLVYRSISIDPSHPVGRHLADDHHVSLDIDMGDLPLGTRQEEEAMVISYLQKLCECDHDTMDSYRNELEVNILIMTELGLVD